MAEKRGGKAKGVRQAWNRGFVAGIYVLSGADVKNGAIRLGKARFLYDARPAGGSAEGPPTVEFVPGGAVDATLAGKNRVPAAPEAATRAFLDAIGAKAGDRLLVERAGARQIRISKAG